MSNNKPQYGVNMSLNQLLRNSIAYDTNYSHVSTEPKGKYTIGREYHNDLYSLISKQKHCLLEKPGHYIPLYFDIDIKKDCKDYKEYINKNGKFYKYEEVKEIISIVNPVIKGMVECSDNELYCCLLEKDIYKKKEYMSGGFHLQWPAIFMCRTDIQNILIPNVKGLIKQKVGYDIDDVYTKNWCMYNGSKSLDLQPYILTKSFDISLKEMTMYETFKNYKIFDTNENPIEITEENVNDLLPRIFSINPYNRDVKETTKNEYKEKVKEKEKRKKKTNDDRNVEEKLAECRKLLPLLSQNRVDEYDDWMRLGWCLFNIAQGCNEGLDLWDEKSQESSKYDAGSCEEKWEKMNLKEDGLNMGSLKQWAKEDSPVEYELLYKKNDSTKIVFIDDDITFNDKVDIKKEDNYYWVDFERKYMNTVFRDYDDLKQNIIQDLPRVLVKITMDEGFYIKKEHDDLICNLIPIKKMKRIVFKYNLTFSNKKGEVKNEILSAKLDDIYTDCRLPLYSHPDMILDKNIKSNAYNIFKGIKAIRVENEKIDMNLIKKFFTHIETIICNDNKEASHFFISWLRWIMIHPHIKTKIFVFLFSKEGYGKSTIGNFLSHYIFGDAASHISSGLNSLTSGFNKHLLGKLFCQIEELPSTSENFHKQFDDMKTLITEDKMFCNPKGLDGFKMNNFLNFLGCSNNKYSLRMPQTDTRYFVQEITKKMNDEYWNVYYNDFQNQKFADMLYSYFLKTKDDDYVKFNGRPKIPMTDLKKELIEFSLPTHEKFYKDIMDGEYKLKKSILKPEFTHNGITYKYASTLKDIWDEFLNWGSINGEKDLKKKYLEFKDRKTGTFRYINLQDKITNVDTLEFKEYERVLF